MKKYCNFCPWGADSAPPMRNRVKRGQNKTIQQGSGIGIKMVRREYYLPLESTETLNCTL